MGMLNERRKKTFVSLSGNIPNEATMATRKQGPTYQTAKGLKYLIRRPFWFVKEMLGKEDIVSLAISHFLVWWGRKGLIAF